MLYTFSMVLSCQPADIWIDDYELEINQGEGCCSQWQSATVGLLIDIGHALPHQASVIKGAKYDSDVERLYFKKDNAYIYVYPKRIWIYTPYIQSNDKVRALVEQTIAILNEAYSESRKVTDNARVDWTVLDTIE